MLSARWEIGPVNLIHINILWDMVKRLQPERPPQCPISRKFWEKRGKPHRRSLRSKTFSPFPQYPLPHLSLLQPLRGKALIRDEGKNRND